MSRGSQRSQIKSGFSPVRLIEKKRDGGELTSDEVHDLIRQFLGGQLEDYQMSAWLMAAYLNGLSDTEMVALTQAMLHSGKLLKLGSVKAVKIDKHSTGGVGDKLSLPLAPLVAAAGVAVPMISGRGLGHTGGTLDKLESIPGFKVGLSAREFERVVSKVGCAIIGQTPELAPADKRIYALRDVTGTVACRPLIVASILSKKLAAGLNGLVLDVKVGRGAFMLERKSARALAKSLVNVSTSLGTPAVALLTQMDVPLGRSIGNALEVAEAIAILRNEGPRDTTLLTLELGVEMLLLAGRHTSRQAALAELNSLLSSGRALEVFAAMIEAQGGDARVIDQPQRLPKAPLQLEIKSVKRGTVLDIDALSLAEVTLDAGAGRRRAQDRVDPAVGLELLVQRGQTVAKGEPLARLHLRSKNDAERLAAATLAAFRVGSPSIAPVTRAVLGRISADVTAG